MVQPEEHQESSGVLSEGPDLGSIIRAVQHHGTEQNRGQDNTGSTDPGSEGECSSCREGTY